MNTENNTDKRHEGQYINGIYTGKDGSVSGLNCPKGVSMVNPNLTPAVFFVPDDTANDEDFKLVDPKNPISKDVLPMYAVSNYGRVINVITNKILKPATREGYEYYTLSTSDSSKGKKISSHRLVLSTFNPIEGMENLQVNHKNLNKKDNYVNKVMPDNTIESNLEWCTSKENNMHRSLNYYPASLEDAGKTREYKKEGYSIECIRKEFFPNLKFNTIKYICENKFYYDPLYDPSKNPMPTIRMKKNSKFSDQTILDIRKLSEQGISNTEIQNKYYPNIPLGTISDIIRKHIHNNV